MLKPVNNQLNSSHIPAIIRELTSVVAVIMDSSGNVLDANKGFLFLANTNTLPDSNWNVQSLFAQPSFKDILAAIENKPNEIVYQGIINIGDITSMCHSVKGTIYLKQERVILFAEHDIADLVRLNASVIELNEELAETQRALVKSNRTLKQKEKEITALMLSDPLTAVANRRGFDARLEEEIERHLRYQHPLCLEMGDIDHFKHINDTFGHDMGDDVICRFADTLSDNKRSSDFVARIGGEEFMLILPQTSLEHARLVVDRIRKLFKSQTYQTIDRPITASFGISQLHEDDNQLSLIKRTDQALYHSKENGRNQVTMLP